MMESIHGINSAGYVFCTILWLAGIGRYPTRVKKYTEAITLLFATQM